MMFPHPRIGAVLFDFDGTLTEPRGIDFAAIRAEIGCPVGTNILEYIAQIPGAADRRFAMDVVERYEGVAASAAQANRGAEDLVRYLVERGVPVGIITRNGYRNVRRALANFPRLTIRDFDIVVTRETGGRPKPAPDGVLFAARMLRVPVDEMLVIGDFVYDIQAGREAGALTALLVPEDAADRFADPPEADETVAELAEIREIVDMRLPLPQGKLPNRQLAGLLRSAAADDSSVLVRPGVGEDVAVTDVAGSEAVVLKSDPITFATEEAGYYAIMVNQNDLVCGGGTPRWFLCSLLFPLGATAADVGNLLSAVADVCRGEEITLVGGHTELTDAVRRPVVSGMLVGTVEKQRILRKQDCRQGDVLILTKGVAVEGTSIVAREFAPLLRDHGVSEDLLVSARSLLDSLSVKEEARIAVEVGGVRAMHDVTEGGLATAVRELSEAAGRAVNVQMERIPILAETRALCDCFGLDPLGLIGSGSLLIVADPRHADPIVRRLGDAGIAATAIGTMEASLPAGNHAVAATRDGRPTEFPEFPADELARLYGP